LESSRGSGAVAVWAAEDLRQIKQTCPSGWGVLPTDGSWLIIMPTTLYEVQEVRDLNIEISFYDSYDSLSSMSQVSGFFQEK